MNSAEREKRRCALIREKEENRVARMEIENKIRLLCQMEQFNKSNIVKLTVAFTDNNVYGWDLQECEIEKVRKVILEILEKRTKA